LAFHQILNLTFEGPNLVGRLALMTLSSKLESPMAVGPSRPREESAAAGCLATSWHIEPETCFLSTTDIAQSQIVRLCLLRETRHLWVLRDRGVQERQVVHRRRVLQQDSHWSARCLASLASATTFVAPALSGLVGAATQMACGFPLESICSRLA
jgi:hypothetical protein